MYMKGKATFSELMDRPFYELHEIYRLVFLRMQAEKERQEKEKKEEEAKRKAEAKRNAPRGIPPSYSIRPIDKNKNSPSSHLSPLQAEELEDALEDLAEGGTMI